MTQILICVRHRQKIVGIKCPMDPRCSQFTQIDESELTKSQSTTPLPIQPEGKPVVEDVSSVESNGNKKN